MKPSKAVLFLLLIILAGNITLILCSDRAHPWPSAMNKRQKLINGKEVIILSEEDSRQEKVPRKTYFQMKPIKRQSIQVPEAMFERLLGTRDLVVDRSGDRTKLIYMPLLHQNAVKSAAQSISQTHLEIPPESQ